MLRRITIILMFSLSTLLLSQSYDYSTSDHPPGKDWHYIDTENYRLIYPDTIESEAIRMANTLEHIRPYLAKSMMLEMKHVDILISNSGAVSNGYAALAPRMSEWFLKPPQHFLLGTGDWLNLLAIHEMRHINQFDYLDRGTIRIGKTLFGDFGHLAPMFAFIPAWYFEGDAVLTETLLSESGRGRLPQFWMRIRANELSGIHHNYYRAYLGSYKYYTPSIYDLGYLMISHIRREHGYEKLQNTLDNAANNAFWPYSFTFASKKHLEQHEKDIYESTMEDCREIWQKQDKAINPSLFEQVNKTEKKVWTQYRFPYQIDDSTVIAFKNGLSHSSQLVELKLSGEERHLAYISPNYMVNHNQRKIVFTEIDPDIRWGSRSYGIIAVYDIPTGQIDRITKKSRYFAPAISPDGERIAAVENDIAGKCHIVIIDSENGEILEKLPNPENYQIQTPSWSDDGKKLVFTHQKYDGKALMFYDFRIDEFTEVLPERHENIAQPIFYENYVVFTSPFSGIDNIYAVDIESGERFRLTSSRFGAFEPSVYYSDDGHYLLYSDYSAMGRNIARIKIKPKDWQPIDEIEITKFDYFKPLIIEEIEDVEVDPEEIEDVPRKIRKYRPILHSLNFHSRLILPLYPYIGAEFYSNDILGTTDASIGGMYNFDDELWSVGASIRYRALYPVISLKGEYLQRKESWIIAETDTIDDFFDEISLGAGLSVPMDLSRGSYYRNANIGANISYTKISGRMYYPEYEMGSGRMFPLKYQASVTNYRKLAPRDLKPRNGGALYGSYTHTPLESDYKGSRATALAAIYIPGIGRHHSFYVKTAREIQEPENYHFDNEVVFPRGYSYKYHKMISKVSLNYEMPLFYPEYALGSIFYVKRFRSNMFYDHGYMRDPGTTYELRSLGGSLTMDFAIFAKPMDFMIGIEYSYRIDEEDHHHFGIQMGDIGLF